MTYPEYNDDNLQQLLIALNLACIKLSEDLMDALQFHDDFRYPMHSTVREIATTISSMLDHYSDSTVDDLIELIDNLFSDFEGN